MATDVEGTETQKKSLLDEAIEIQNSCPVSPLLHPIFRPFYNKTKPIEVRLYEQQYNTLMWN